MSKDIKRVLKGMKRYANPPSSYGFRLNKHYRVSWKMLNDNGEIVTVRTTIGSSPHGACWMRNHKTQLKRTFRELNISTEVNHI